MKKLLVLLAFILTGCSTYTGVTPQYNSSRGDLWWDNTCNCWNPYWSNFNCFNFTLRPYYWTYIKPTRPQVIVPRRGNSNINRPVQTVRPNYRTVPTRPSTTRVRPVNKRSKNLRNNN